MKCFNQKIGMVEEAKKAKFLPNGFLQVLIFLAVFFGSQLVVGVGVGIIVGIMMAISGNIDLNGVEETVSFYMLFATVFVSIIVILYVLLVERRRLKSMGLGRKNLLKDYFIGYIVGVSLFSICILILVLSGNMKYNGMNSLRTVLPMTVAFFIGFLLQGSEEEIIFRGYLMPSLAARHNIIIAIIINSCLFGAAHLMNSHVTFLSIFNIILFGLFASIYALKFNSIWGVCAIHSAWNFVQGNIFGLQVSGMDKMVTIWRFEATGKDILTGGAFGPEGGIVVTIVLIIAIFVLFKINLKRNYV